MVTVFVLVGWVFSLCLHEFSHALVAYIGGDKSVKDKGYLTFNPLRYAHPVTTLIIPIAIFIIGGIPLPGGAVYIDRSRLRSKTWDSLVSLAGPGANLLLAALMAIPFIAGPADLGSEGWFWPAWAYLALLQVACVFLNLLPIPPLDGFGAIAPYLDENLRTRCEQNAIFGFAIVFVLFWVIPGVNEFFWLELVYPLSSNLGIRLDLAGLGQDMFKF